MKFIFSLIVSATLISCSEKYTGKISFKNCSVNYPVHDEEKEREIYNGHNVPNQWEYESAMRKLAVCLCEKYIQKPDPQIKVKIIEIYTYKFEFYSRNDAFKKVNFDSILMNRNDIFNSEILVD